MAPKSRQQLEQDHLNAQKEFSNQQTQWKNRYQPQADKKKQGDWGTWDAISHWPGNFINDLQMQGAYEDYYQSGIPIKQVNSLPNPQNFNNQLDKAKDNPSTWMYISPSTK